MAKYVDLNNWDVVIETWERDENGNTLYTHIIRQEQEYQNDDGTPVNDPNFPNKWVQRARHNNADPEETTRQSAQFIAEKGDPNVYISGTIEQLTEQAKNWLDQNPPDATAQERIDAYVAWVQNPANAGATMTERNAAAQAILINGDLDHPNLS